MAYKAVSELPQSVCEELTKEGQEIYISAFKLAWEQLTQSDEVTRTEMAHQAAWDKVRETYEKQGNRWQRTIEQEDNECSGR